MSVSALGVGRASRPPALSFALSLALALAGACATSSGGPSSLSSVPEVKQLDTDGAAALGAPGLTRWCDEEAPPVTTNAPPEIVKGMQALSAMSLATLKQHVRSDVQARVERAMFLHAADAISVNDEPLDPMTGVEKEVFALLAEAKACNAALVTGEMRIDFPPPFNDTPDENAQEIDAVHAVLYAGTSVTAYCGPCAIYAFVVAPHPGGEGLDVIAWDSLVGVDPMGH